MEVDFLGAMGSAFAMLSQPQMLMYMFIGVVIGTLMSVIPGVGGLMGIALLLPFTFGMSSYEAMAFLLGAMAVMSTADTIPAILFGVPGTPTSMVTVLDGYPMAKRGEAGRALGAAFTSSVIGGVFGALVLLLVIPVIMPVMMGATSAELLAFCLLGLAMVAALAGGAISKGLAAAGIGIMLAFIGQDANTATLRWTFGSFYLWDGLHILVVALGIYAIPELADLAIQSKAIAADRKRSTMDGAAQGFKDTMRNILPVTRNSAASSALGVIPAIGPAVIPWLVYSFTSLTTRGKKNFGQGDVRGVIAAESSNNATVGGSLLPTVVLGVPGSAPMALLLGAFLLHGIAPGPDMLTRNLDVTYMMVWTIVIANVIGGIFAFGLAKPLSQVVFVRSAILVPLIASVVFVGALQSSRQWEDVMLLVAIGVVGWLMKRVHWPRAPLFLAFILAPLVEQYFFITMNIHGWAWTTRPVVMVLLAITGLFMVGVAISRVRKLWLKRRSISGFHWELRWGLDALFSLAVAVVSALALWQALGWPAAASTMPVAATSLCLVTSLVALVGGWIRPTYKADAEQAEEQHFDLITDFGELTPTQVLWRGLRFLLLFGVLGVASWLIGLMWALPIFLLVYMLVMGEKLKMAVPVVLGFWAVAYVLFEHLLRLAWPNPLVDIFAWLN
ncbi:tripartite tricarboxylate transporter permease [Halomonas sp. ML-15]|uniref:tripartite tricarboxylate transporter permease n=1 Tax=Halomonas sp. ML-15 TaxID=2773305 RepID=UPI00174653D0|nr:tripartite tricarboxylate transporter permease [Halomonas sp. ML-15]MBD3895587.1 tripartite tricarboxylate transporter permease [Halomonas sp. ML-15]